MNEHSMDEQTTIAESDATANDRFKRSFSAWFWGSMIAATAVHFAVFAFWPQLQAEDVSLSVDEMEAVDIPPPIEIPPPPEAIARPATPVVTDVAMDEDITIEVTTFEANPVDNLPPPPSEVETDISSAPVFTPMTVRPGLKNEREVQRALEREYPPLLRDAGIGGTVRVHFFITEEGVVKDTRIDESSGHSALDEAALRVADVFEFTPALNRDKKVPVWISLPITFTTT